MGEQQPDPPAVLQNLSLGPAQVPIKWPLEMGKCCSLSGAYPAWNQPSLLITQAHNLMPGPSFQYTETLVLLGNPICLHQ